MSTTTADRIEAALADWWKTRDAGALLPVLVAGLGAADAEARSRALRGFRLLGAEAAQALPPLLDLLAHAGTDEAPVIAGTLAMVAPEHPVVGERLERGSQEECHRILRAFAEVGERARGAEAAIEGATRDPRHAVRRQAAGVLWKVARRADVAFPILQQEALGEDLYAGQLHEIDAASWPELRRMWPDAVDHLAEMIVAQPTLLDSMRPLLTSASPVECLNACRVFFLAGAPRADLVGPLRRVLAMRWPPASYLVFLAASELLVALGPTARAAAAEIEILAALMPPWREIAKRVCAAIAGALLLALAGLGGADAAPATETPSSGHPPPAAENSIERLFDQVFDAPSPPAGAELHTGKIGQVLDLRLPAGWRRGNRRDEAFFSQAFHPTADPRVALVFRYRGHRIGAAASARLGHLLAREPGVIDVAEVRQLDEILGELARDEEFAIESATVEAVQGRRVLAIEGRYRNHPVRKLAFFVEADRAPAGTAVQELVFVAPNEAYARYLPDVRGALASIVWR